MRSVDDVVAAVRALAGDDVTAWSDAQVRDGLPALLGVHNQVGG